MKILENKKIIVIKYNVLDFYVIFVKIFSCQEIKQMDKLQIISLIAFPKVSSFMKDCEVIIPLRVKEKHKINLLTHVAKIAKYVFIINVCNYLNRAKKKREKKKSII